MIIFATIGLMVNLRQNGFMIEPYRNIETSSISGKIGISGRIGANIAVIIGGLFMLTSKTLLDRRCTLNRDWSFDRLMTSAKLLGFESHSHEQEFDQCDHKH